MRVYSSEDREVGRWVMRTKDIEGLSREQVQNKFALESVPKYISDVSVPEGTPMRLGLTAPQPEWNVMGGGTQYELRVSLPEDSFQNGDELDEIFDTRSRFNY